MTAIQASLWPDKNSTDPAVVEKDYDKAAQSYSDNVLQDGWQASFDRVIPVLTDILLKKPRQSVKLLDAGCGDGLLPERFDFSKYSVELFGCDLSSEMLAIAGRNGKYADLKTANIEERIPFDDDSFDVLVSNGVLGYIETNRPLGEFLRVTKPGGCIMFTMRQQQFNERHYPDAIKEAGCVIIHQEVFSAFPNNPEYKHPYLFTHLIKMS